MDSIKRVNSFIKQFERKVKQSNKWLADRQKEQGKLYNERKEKYEKIEEENRRIQYSLELLAKDTRNFEYLERLSDQIEKRMMILRRKKKLWRGYCVIGQ